MSPDPVWSYPVWSYPVWSYPVWWDGAALAVIGFSCLAVVAYRLLGQVRRLFLRRPGPPGQGCRGCAGACGPGLGARRRLPHQVR